MAMHREDMRDEVRANLKRTISGFADSRINTHLNWAQGYLADLHTYEEMRSNDTTKSTTQSSVSITWPTRMKDLYSMKVQDGARSRKLIYVLARDFDKEIPRPATYTEGLPNWYVDYGSTFELFQIPDATYILNIRCSVYPVDFANDAAESALLRKDALICAIATVFGFWSLRELEDATYWGQQIVPPLYEASLTGDHSGEDWVPIARGFRTQAPTLQGSWWTNPFTSRSVPGY